MAKAELNGITLAESTETVIIEGNHYFPQSSVKMAHFSATDLQTHCPWKGDASYYTISVGGDEKANAAWTYLAPKDAAKEIKDHIAFYKNIVQISE